jgi:hypothetical protein
MGKGVPGCEPTDANLPTYTQTQPQFTDPIITKEQRLTMTKCYNNAEENKLSSDANSRKFGIFKNCECCDAPIILKLRELWEIQNPHDWSLWNRILVKRWWDAFDADDSNRRHHCCKQRHQKKLQQWLEV